MGGKRLRAQNLIIAGVNRAGTTSLFATLAEHPDICPSDIKETHYFMPIRYGERLAAFGNYTELFSDCADQEFRMEATPGYFAGGGPVASAIAETLGEDTRILLSLRNPATRALSWYRFMRARGMVDEEMSFLSYVEKCLTIDDAEGARETVAWRGISGGDYARFLPVWLEMFGDNVGVVYFESLVDCGAEVAREIEDWLRLRPVVKGVRSENRGRNVRSVGLEKIAQRSNRGFERTLRRNQGVKQALRRVYLRLNGKKPVPESGIVEGLALLDTVFGSRKAEVRNLLDRATELAPRPAWAACD